MTPISPSHALAFGDPIYREIRTQMFSLEMGNLLTPEILHSWETLCAAFSQRASLCESIDLQINAWTPTHPETLLFKKEWKELIQCFRAPKINQLDTAITKITRLHLFAHNHGFFEFKQILSPHLNKSPEPDLAAKFDGIGKLRSPTLSSFPLSLSHKYMQLALSLEPLHALGQYCCNMSDGETAGHLFATSIILATQNVPEARHEFHRLCHVRDHLFAFQPEDLKKLIEISQADPRWSDCSLRQILDHPKKHMSVLFPYMINRRYLGNENRFLLYLIFFRALPESLTNPELVKYICWMIQEIANSEGSFSFRRGILLQEYLDFITVYLPDAFEEESLEGIAAAFSLSANPFHERENFDRIFSFFKSRPIFLKTSVWIRSLVWTLRFTAEHSHPSQRRALMARNRFDELFAFCQENSFFTNPLFRKELEITLKELRGWIELEYQKEIDTYVLELLSSF